MKEKFYKMFKYTYLYYITTEEYEFIKWKHILPMIKKAGFLDSNFTYNDVYSSFIYYDKKSRFAEVYDGEKLLHRYEYMGVLIRIAEKKYYVEKMQNIFTESIYLSKGNYCLYSLYY